VFSISISNSEKCNQTKAIFTSMIDNVFSACSNKENRILVEITGKTDRQ